MRNEALPVSRQFRIEPQNIASYFDARRYALNQIDRPGHGAEVDALRGGSLLDIVYVAVQRFYTKKSIARCRSEHASTQPNAARDSVQPCDERSA